MPYHTLGEEEVDRTKSNYACCCAIICALVIIFPTAFLFLSTLRSEKANPILWSLGLFVFLLIVFFGCALAGFREKVRKKRQDFSPYLSGNSPDSRGISHTQSDLNAVVTPEQEKRRRQEEEERAHENGWRYTTAATRAETSNSRVVASTHNRADDLELPKKYCSEYERPASLHLPGQ